MIEIQPYLTTFDSPFGSGDIAKPGVKPIIVTDIPIHHFNKHVKLAGYFKQGDGELWWVDGMQREVVSTVHILTDDVEEGIYSGYCAMDNRDYFKLLGRLVDDNETTERFRDEFAKYLMAIGKR